MSAYLQADGIDVAQQRTAYAELRDLQDAYGDLAAEAGLAAASFAPPPWGTAADLFSIGRSLWQGRWGDAFFDTVGVIPLFGDGIKGGRLANRMLDLERAISVAHRGVSQALRRTQDAATRYWDDIVRANRQRYDDAIRNCGADRRWSGPQGGPQGASIQQRAP